MVAVDSSSPTSKSENGQPQTGLLVVGLATAVMTLSLLQTLVVPVLSRIAEQLDADLTAVAWVLTANLLAAAVATPVLGRMGDVYGRRPVMLGILVTVLIGILLALFTSSLPILILARVLQGTSYGLFPLSMGVLREEVPPHQLTSSMALVSATLGVGGVVGLLATGLLTQGDASYHRPFWFGLAVTLIALVIGFFTLPRRAPDGHHTSVDWIGGFILGGGLVLLLLPISQGERWGWGSPLTIGLFVAAVVVLGGWLVVEGRIAQPLASPKLLANRGVAMTNLAGLLVGFGLFGAFLGITDFVETPSQVTGYGFGASVLRASALYLLPGGVAGVIAAPFIGKYVHKVGGGRALATGAIFGLIGFAGMALFHDRSWHMIVFGIFTQLAVTFGFATLPALLVQSVSPAETGVANSVNSIMRSVGSAVASALIVSLLTAMADDRTGLPSEGAYVVIFTMGAVAFAIVALIGLFGVRGHRPVPAQEEREEAAVSMAGEFSPVSGLSS
ncbi:MFS transporter [Kineosporia mesophila]|uniref:MFS transporter n=1 Tax=Kineosporia mesophila TaxID=566012 RepID=A0ABP6ZJM0_9ACTN|nr:MFS transporter [Kineosporia mesophila]MCD5349579.1 MFS transporter [Kineosporia mesophila]